MLFISFLQSHIHYYHHYCNRYIIFNIYLLPPQKYLYPILSLNYCSMLVFSCYYRLCYYLLLILLLYLYLMHLSTFPLFHYSLMNYLMQHIDHKLMLNLTHLQELQLLMLLPNLNLLLLELLNLYHLNFLFFMIGSLTINNNWYWMHLKKLIKSIERKSKTFFDISIP